MELFSRYTAWAGYMGFRLAAAAVDEAQAESELETVQAKILLSSWGGVKTDRVTVARAERESHPDVIRLRDAWLKAKAYRKMLQSLHENVERELQTVSRELTRRTTPPEKRRHDP